MNEWDGMPFDDLSTTPSCQSGTTAPTQKDPTIQHYTALPELAHHRYGEGMIQGQEFVAMTTQSH